MKLNHLKTICNSKRHSIFAIATCAHANVNLLYDIEKAVFNRAFSLRECSYINTEKFKSFVFEMAVMDQAHEYGTMTIFLHDIFCVWVNIMA
jgi:hypothetical protein